MIIRNFEIVIAVPEDSINSYLSADKLCEELRDGNTCEDCAVEVKEKKAEEVKG